MLYVVVFDFLIDIDIVLMEDFWVVERLENRGLKSVGEERIFVWGLEASNQRVKFLSFSQCPVEEAEVAVGDTKSSWLVDGAVHGELDSFNEVESDGVLQSTVKSIWSATVCFQERCTYMSWKRMLERSKALEASERSIAASIVYNGGGGND